MAVIENGGKAPIQTYVRKNLKMALIQNVGP